MHPPPTNCYYLGMTTKHQPARRRTLTPEQIAATELKRKSRSKAAKAKAKAQDATLAQKAAKARLKPPTPAKAPLSDILVNILLDRSGSMQSCRAETISGFNEYIAGLRADTRTNYRLTLTQFDTHDGKVDLYTPYADKPIADVPGLIPATYEPRGLTPLYDAIGSSIEAARPGNRPVLMVILTDGENNASKEYDLPKVQKLIQERESKGWTFVYIGADIDAYGTGDSMGLQVGNTVSAASVRTANIYQNLAGATVAYAQNRRSTGVRGQTAGECFFSATNKMDMGDQTAQDQTAQTNLNDWQNSTHYTGTGYLGQSNPFGQDQTFGQTLVPVPPFTIPEPPPSPYVTVKEAARRLNVSKYVLYGQVQQGKFPATKVGREWRIHTDDLKLKP